MLLLGIYIGTRVDGHYVIDIIGAPFAVLIVYTLLRFVEPLLYVRPGLV